MASKKMDKTTSLMTTKSDVIAIITAVVSRFVKLERW